ncbi:glycosyl transferase group 1 [Gloeomargarita lithophora Alchichica-D10]|uniref:Glycosyl transferase group 1 n=2 Tax=Gloeomargarita TaxID=1188227 RepID=A0A1J0AC96_9CYAN|nr:glycosyl transferase group 1 [Gloeomargarita lithophora Alchichica-D10]
MRILCVSTPVGPLGSGLGGGVELTLANLAIALQQRGHTVTVIAPAGSRLPGVPLMTVPGAVQPIAQNQGRQDPITMPAGGVLSRMWQAVRSQPWDVAINLAYDWLPLYLTQFFDRPVVHLVSMGSLVDYLDEMLAQITQTYPHRIAMHTQAQASTFGAAIAQRTTILGNGLDLSQYEFCPQPATVLGWVGRIAPEKGLGDALTVSRQTGMPLRIMGKIHDPDYWRRICTQFPEAEGYYQGFLSTDELQKHLGQCLALLVTPHWVEAFGNVVMEALACGVPVLSYALGGPGELVRPGETGWLVPPGDVAGLAQAVTQVGQIHRQHCRLVAEQEFSLAAWGERVEQWLQQNQS